MKSDEKLDLLLKHALSPTDEPDNRLNQSILRKAKEMECMKKGYKKRIPAAALAAVFVLALGGVTAAAALKYMAPDKVAEELEDKGLAAAFQGEDAIAINETQTYGNYMITLLGVVSGKSLSAYMAESNGEIKADRTYVVTAIENADGTPRPETSDETYGEESFFVSPLIKGCNPAEYNSVTMNGGYSEFVQDGIQYRIAECDNVEIFADRGLYLCVVDDTFYNPDAYRYDEATGEITRNENYEGVNALFQLPLDKSKADPKAAEEYMQKMHTEERETEEDAITEEDAALNAVTEEIENWSEEELEEKAVLVKELTLTPDKNGEVSYHYELDNGAGAEASGWKVEDIFKEGQVGMSDFKSMGISDGLIIIEVYTRDGDGIITLKVYEYQIS